jgi:hypothetical protein
MDLLAVFLAASQLHYFWQHRRSGGNVFFSRIWAESTINRRPHTEIRADAPPLEWPKKRLRRSSFGEEGGRVKMLSRAKTMGTYAT